jgi:hypothetical protein
MTFPVLAAVRPSSIGTAANGEIATDLLVNVRRYERYDLLLAPEMAATYQTLVADCLAATGVQLGISGGGAYRTIDHQINLFFQRYETPPRPGRPTRHYNGRTYSLRPGMAAAATPGTSNHGLGVAVDLEVIDPVTGAETDVSGSPAWPWLLENAVAHGLSWELQSEPWHLRLVTLDSPTPSAPSPEPTPTPVPGPVSPVEGDDDMRFVRDADTQRFWEWGTGWFQKPDGGWEWTSWASPTDEIGLRWEEIAPLINALGGLKDVPHDALQSIYDRHGRPPVGVPQ